MSMEMAEDIDSPIPDNVSDSLNKSLLDLQHITSNFDDFLADLPPNPLDRAQSLLTLARLSTSLFSLRLRCAGIRPEDHRVKAEMDRMGLYREKLERNVRLNKAPLRPSTKLNFQAATRVIHHSLPDLSDDQRQSFKELSKNESGRLSAMERSREKKRKYESPVMLNSKSVRAAAAEFLEKAARELRGEQQEGYRGPYAPILIEDSSDEGEQEEEEVEEEEKEEEQCEKVAEMDHTASASTAILIDSSDDY